MLILEIAAGIWIAFKVLALERAFDTWCSGTGPSFHADDAQDDAEWSAMSARERERCLNGY